MNVERIYRPDIDGLRALAVLAILFFHAGYGWAAGGFIGVDVFFVISGYLITRNIASDIERGEFSFARFYTRRVRRLFPALFFTLFVSFIFSFVLFTPPELERFGESLLYAIFSLSNFFFWSEAGYFNTASEFKPLLHVWSLSVEEQFYLIWPALLVVLSRRTKRADVAGLLALSAIVSVLISQLLISKHAEAVFFLLPFRVFEFAIGALCVFVVGRYIKSARTRELLVFAGTFLIVYPVVTYSDAIPFPGFRAVVPCIGTALIIICGGAGKDGRAPVASVIFRNPLAVGIGLISYSLYLAHWPLLVFYKYWHFSPLTSGDRLLFVAVSIVAGFLMWRFVERPFRFKRGSAQSTKPDVIKFWAPGLAVALALVAAVTLTSRGWPSRLPAEFFMTKEQVKKEWARYWNDFHKDPEKVLMGTGGGRDIIIMGNSHAMDLVYSLRENGAKANFTFFNTTGRCYNFGASPFRKMDKEHCEMTRAKNLSSNQWSTVDKVYLHDSWTRTKMKDLEEILREIRSLTDAPIYVFGPKMQFSKDVPEIIRKSMKKNAPALERVSIKSASINSFGMRFIDERRAPRNDILRTLLSGKEFAEDNFFFIDILTTQCGERVDKCEIISTENSKFLYFDKHHFTLRGAGEFGARLKRRYPEVFN
ncbi:MAG: acyltransferase family protein [Thermodesulfobacteriota bacterium]